jgi:lipopolysaccharide/colanic/teichoic acid biosynthesis glycosyltransferase
MNMRSEKFMRAALLVKRIFDLIVSLLIVAVFFPIWLIVAVIIKIDSPGPVFFLQNRPGFKREIIKVYKFRSMRVNSELMIKGQEVSKDDSRITSAGKFLRRSKIDEAPQLLNVITGKMSLVGPRPERIESLADYTDEISKRLNMKPGLTGLAQVSGNIYLALKDRYRFDVYYVEHYSLLLDLKILFRTVGVVLFGEEKYIDKPLIKLEDEPEINSDIQLSPCNNEEQIISISDENNAEVRELIEK